MPAAIGDVQRWSQGVLRSCAAVTTAHEQGAHGAASWDSRVILEACSPTRGFGATRFANRPFGDRTQALTFWLVVRRMIAWIGLAVAGGGGTRRLGFESPHPATPLERATR
jgi:hypothetical protein